MPASTIIIDYGMGNLRSVQKAFERIGESAVISSSATEIAQAARVVLPGVGAFRDAIAALRHHQLVDVIRDIAGEGRPFLGICLGLQLLFDRSLEEGDHQGLGILPGEVRRFQLPNEYKVPHMGWNQLVLPDPDAPAPLLSGIRSDAWFYFVHSYYVVPQRSSDIAAGTDYGGQFTSVVARGNVMATQFHPEKSQAAGRQLLSNFLHWEPAPRLQTSSRQSQE